MLLGLALKTGAITPYPGGILRLSVRGDAGRPQSRWIALSPGQVESFASQSVFLPRKAPLSVVERGFSAVSANIGGFVLSHTPPNGGVTTPSSVTRKGGAPALHPWPMSSALSLLGIHLRPSRFLWGGRFLLGASPQAHGHGASLLDAVPLPDRVLPKMLSLVLPPGVTKKVLREKNHIKHS
jgi:hypothetical protein